MLQQAKVNLVPFLPGGPLVRKGWPYAENFAITVRTMFDMGIVCKFMLDEDDAQKTKG